MHRIVNDAALDRLFRAARGRPDWLATPVSQTMLRALWELARFGPTCREGGAAHVRFAVSADARARLAPAVADEHRAALTTAPVAGIVAGPVGDDPATAGAREAALQAASIVLAARALGLDCEPIWEFDAAFVDRAFFADERLQAHWLCLLGYGDATGSAPYAPRPGFEEACSVV